MGRKPGNDIREEEENEHENKNRCHIRDYGQKEFFHLDIVGNALDHKQHHADRRRDQGHFHKYYHHYPKPDGIKAQLVIIGK